MDKSATQTEKEFCKTTQISYDRPYRCCFSAFLRYRIKIFTALRVDLQFSLLLLHRHDFCDSDRRRGGTRAETENGPSAWTSGSVARRRRPKFVAASFVFFFCAAEWTDGCERTTVVAYLNRSLSAQSTVDVVGMADTECARDCRESGRLRKKCK